MESKYKYRELIELKGLLRKCRYTYEKMANFLNISVSAFSDKINGKSVFTILEVYKMITALGIKYEEIGVYFF